MGFPGGTSGKEPACQCRRPRNTGSIPGWGRSPGEIPTHLPGNPMDRGTWWTTVHRVAESDTTEVT